MSDDGTFGDDGTEFRAAMMDVEDSTRQRRHLPHISRPFAHVHRYDDLPDPLPSLSPSPSPSPSSSYATTSMLPSQRLRAFLSDHRHSEPQPQPQHQQYQQDDVAAVDGPPWLPPGPAEGATVEQRAAYGLALSRQLNELHAWVEREQPPLREALHLQLRLEMYMADCAARCPDLFCTVWRFGDTLDPHDQTRGQRSSFQTLLFFELMQLRIYVRNLKIAHGRAPHWEEDERPQQFAWLTTQGLVVTKHSGIGSLPLSSLDQLLYTLLQAWLSCQYHPELDTYVSRLLDRMALLVCFPHHAAAFGTEKMLAYVQPLHRRPTERPQQQQQQQQEEAEAEAEEEGEEDMEAAMLVDDLFLDEQERELARQRRRATRKANHVARHAALTQAQEERVARQFRNEIQSGSTQHLYAANYDLMYRCQLRCWQLTRALNQYHLLPRRARDDWLRDYPVLTMSAWQRDEERVARLRLCLTPQQVEARVVQKAATVHPTLAEQLRHYMMHHTMAPEDWWWIAHMIPTSSRVPDAILEKLHGKHKNRLVDEVGRPPTTWLGDKRPARTGFREYTILQLFDKALPPEVLLFLKYVTLREHVERDLHLFAGTEQEGRPRLVQLFSRFLVVYRGHVLDGTADLYEALSLWLRIMAADFWESRMWRRHLQPFLMDEQQVQADARQEIVFL